MSVFSTIKELCSRLRSDTVEISQHVRIAALVHEVTIELPSSVFNINMLHLTSLQVLSSLQLFLSISPKVVDCISTVKIGQVCQPPQNLLQVNLVYFILFYIIFAWYLAFTRLYMVA